MINFIRSLFCKHYFKEIARKECSEKQPNCNECRHFIWDSGWKTLSFCKAYSAYSDNASRYCTRFNNKNKKKDKNYIVEKCLDCGKIRYVYY
jgi:hypothetical protein